MDEIFRQVPSREIPDMARLDGRDGGMDGGEGRERDETGMAQDTRPSLTPSWFLLRCPSS